MSEDKQQTRAEAVVECVADEKERLRLLNLYEPDELAAALLRQVEIANAFRKADADAERIDALEALMRAHGECWLAVNPDGIRVTLDDQKPSDAAHPTLRAAIDAIRREAGEGS